MTEANSKSLTSQMPPMTAGGGGSQSNKKQIRRACDERPPSIRNPLFSVSGDVGLRQPRGCICLMELARNCRSLWSFTDGSAPPRPCLIVSAYISICRRATLRAAQAGTVTRRAGVWARVWAHYTWNCNLPSGVGSAPCACATSCPRNPWMLHLQAFLNSFNSIAKITKNIKSLYVQELRNM